RPVRRVAGLVLGPLRLSGSTRAVPAMGTHARVLAAVPLHPRVPRRDPDAWPLAHAGTRAAGPAVGIREHAGVLRGVPVARGVAPLSGVRRMTRYVRLFGVQLRVSLALAAQYRADFSLEGLMALFWLAWNLVPLVIVYRQRGDIAGWSYEQALLVIGWFTVLKALLDAAITPSLM